MLMPFSSAFTVHNLGIDITHLPTIYLVSGLFSIVTGPLVGRASDRFGKYPTFVFGSVVSVIMAVSADLGEALENFVTKLVASGRYHSKSEVLREGVRLIQEREARLAALDAAIARGLEDADAGRIKPSSEVFDRLEARLAGKADRS